jgi:HAD superfamily hydrolase (TIGR01509 family)
VALPEAAIFDWDGTIVDTMGLIYKANVVVLRHHGIELTRASFRERYTPDWRKAYADLGVPESLWDETARQWSAEISRGRPRALPWARGGLRRLRQHGVRLGLVTASMRAVVEPNLARLNLAGVFATTWCADDVDRAKPHPEALLRALDVLGVPASRSVYVGDTLTDLEMAQAAGAEFAAVGATTTPEVFREAGANKMWPSVGAWVDDVLAGSVPPRRGSASG